MVWSPIEIGNDQIRCWGFHSQCAKTEQTAIAAMLPQSCLCDNGLRAMRSRANDPAVQWVRNRRSIALQTAFTLFFSVFSNPSRTIALQQNLSVGARFAETGLDNGADR